jgi:hypothetical protein
MQLRPMGSDHRKSMSAAYPVDYERIGNLRNLSVARQSNSFRSPTDAWCQRLKLEC